MSDVAKQENRRRITPAQRTHPSPSAGAFECVRELRAVDVPRGWDRTPGAGTAAATGPTATSPTTTTTHRRRGRAAAAPLWCAVESPSLQQCVSKHATCRRSSLFSVLSLVSLFSLLSLL